MSDVLVGAETLERARALLAEHGPLDMTTLAKMLDRVVGVAHAAVHELGCVEAARVPRPPGQRGRRKILWALPKTGA